MNPILLQHPAYRLMAASAAMLLLFLVLGATSPAFHAMVHGEEIDCCLTETPDKPGEEPRPGIPDPLQPFCQGGALCLESPPCQTVETPPPSPDLAFLHLPRRVGQVLSFHALPRGPPVRN